MIEREHSLSALCLLPACGKRETAVEAGIRTQTLLVGNGGEPGSLDPLLVPFFLRFNVTKAPFDNQKVRRALAIAIDRAGIVPQTLVCEPRQFRSPSSSEDTVL